MDSSSFQNSGSVTNLEQEYIDHPRIKNYDVGKIIGVGSNAIVRFGQSKEDGKKVAIKIYDKMKIFDAIKKNN